MSRKKLTWGILESNRLPSKKMMFVVSNKDKVLSLSKLPRNLAIVKIIKSSEFDIKKAISAKIIKLWESFLSKNKNYIAIVLVPSFSVSARSSLFFHVFWLHFSGSIFFWTDVMSVCLCGTKPDQSKVKRKTHSIMVFKCLSKEFDFSRCLYFSLP